MSIDTRYRSTAPEIMDDFNMEGEILRDALDKIASINQLLGGNKVTLQGLQTLIKTEPAGTTIRITDIGCGNGDMLRVLAKYAERSQLKFELLGIDANQFTIAHARNLSAGYTNISYGCEDIFDQSKQSARADIILCTLTLHHFRDEEIITLLQRWLPDTRLGIVINDLERSGLAYRLFRLLCYVFGLNDMSREDGLVSILRGFKRKDLHRYSGILNLKKYTIKWKWAFRYQWIIKTA
jgi:2-polyprenyl-3-methyl-5-hydroxy-6-metoxy-1,4-benzoquinol methylase